MLQTAILNTKIQCGLKLGVVSWIHCGKYYIFQSKAGEGGVKSMGSYMWVA